MKVVAFEIDRIHFFYTCPFCQSTHQHGSNGEFHNRVEYRATHCQKNTENMEIYINDYTKRVLGKTKRKGKHAIIKKNLIEDGGQTP